MLYKARELGSWSVSAGTKDGTYIPCRPEGAKTIPSAWRRIKVAIGVLVGKYDAVDWEMERYGQPFPIAKRCNLPPEGWYCTRGIGHEGPCAARPTTDRKQK